MMFSKEDLFCEAFVGTGADAVAGEVLDLGLHGEQMTTNLWWLVYAVAAKGGEAATIIWETADDADFASPTEVCTKAVTIKAKGDYPVANEPLPKGLKRYNRLKVNAPATVTLFAGLIDGRTEPLVKA